LKLKSHGELWEYVDKLARETGDKDLGRLWRSASSMHTNFYEGWATRGHVAEAIEDVEIFLEKVKRIS